MVVSNDHEGIRVVAAEELPGTPRHWRVVYFERNVLSHAPMSSEAEVAEDLKANTRARKETTPTLVEEFVELYGGRFPPKGISVSGAGMRNALAYLGYPESHHARTRTAKMRKHLFKEVKRRTRLVGVFLTRRARALGDRVSLEEQALKRYLMTEAPTTSKTLAGAEYP